MKKLFLLAVTFAFCLGMSIDSLAQKSNCGTDVNNLSVEFENNSENDLIKKMITSDNKGPYVTTSKSTVQFQITNCYFDMIVNLGRSGRLINVSIPGYANTTANFANFDRIATVPITDWNNENFKAFCKYTTDVSNVSATKNPDGSYQYDNYAGCGYDAASGRYFVRRSVAFQTALSGDKRVRYNYSTLDNTTGISKAAGTSYIRVFASYVQGGFNGLDSNGNQLPNTWEISPEPSVLKNADGTIKNSTVASWSALLNYNTSPVSVINNYDMPFKVTVKRP